MPRSTVLALILIQNQTRLPRLPLLPRGAGVRVAQSVLNSFQQSALPVFCCSSRLDKRHSPKTQSQPGRDAKSHRAEGAVSFMETKKNQRALSLVMIRWVVRSCMTNFMTSCESEVTPAVSILIYLRMDYLSSRIVNRVTFCSHRQLGDSGSLVSRLAGYWASRRSCSVFIRSDNSFRCSGWVLARFSASPRSFFRL